ncbi:MAG TPA: type II toxin-antitoxin system VapC family toxin [Terracidiphilus sp.]|nr:type II toxin-antitoxin system VapC family toxin [Terracidiphilus sp.]
MPDTAVLDSSAVLALLQNEAGSATVGGLVHGALLSAVNLSEVHSKLIQKGMPAALSWMTILSLQCDVWSFTDEQARVAAELIPLTKRYGLSLGDRACLALAIERKAKVYTADRNWKNLSLGVEVEVIR